MKNRLLKFLPIFIILLLITDIVIIIMQNYYSLSVILTMSILLFIYRQIPKYENITDTYKNDTFRKKYYKFNEKKVLICIDINEYVLLERLYTKNKRNNILKQVSNIIINNTKTDLITRKYNDKFFVCIKYQNKEKIEKIIKNINSDIQKIKVSDKYILSCCFGVSYCDKNRLEDEELECFIALKKAKESYNNYYDFYEKEDFDKKINNKRIIDELIYSLNNNNLLVYLQPIYETKTKKISGAEALIRIERDNKIIPAGEFIDLAEKEGLITLIDRFIFVEVCKIISNCKKEKIDFKKIAVNVSRETLELEDTLSFYEENFKKYGINKGEIELEITERNSTMSELNSFKSIIKKLEKLFLISVDDFGTGYSTLSMLSEYNIDTLKIDRSFVNSDLDKNKRIIEHLVKLSNELNIKTVAEGVSEEKEYEFLKNIGCTYLQGYYFSKPMSSEEFKTLIKK